MIKGKPIEKTLQPAKTTFIIRNLLTATDQQIKQAYKTLLRTSIQDDTILEIMTQEENMKKIKQRLQHQLICRDQHNNTLMNIDTFNKTTKTVKEELKGIFTDEHIKEQYLNKQKKHLTTKGYHNIESKKTGKLNHINAIITFRKQK